MSLERFKLGFLVLALAVLDVALLERARSGALAAQSMLLFALASAQTTLAVLWLVAGTGPLALRLIGCAIALAACQHAFAGHEAAGLPYRLFVEADFNNLTFALGLTFVLMARQLWIRFRGTRPSSELPRAGRQFSTLDLLLLVTTTGIALACWQQYRLHRYTPSMNYIFLPARVAVALATLWAALGGGNPLRRVAAPFVVAIGTAWALVALGQLPRDMAWFPAAQLSLDATILLVLSLVVRAAGVRFADPADEGPAASGQGDWLARRPAVRESTP